MYRNEKSPDGSINQEDLHLASDLYGFEISSIVEVYYLPIVFVIKSNFRVYTTVEVPNPEVWTSKRHKVIKWWPKKKMPIPLR